MPNMKSGKKPNLENYSVFLETLGIKNHGLGKPDSYRVVSRQFIPKIQQFGNKQFQNKKFLCKFEPEL